MIETQMTVEITPVPLQRKGNPATNGRCGFKAIIDQAEAYVATLHAQGLPDRAAILGRVRGTGPGVSFGSVVEAIKSTLPVQMKSPFEGSDHVAGGVLLPAEAGIDGRDDGLLFLRFAENTGDLPLHTHEHSDRLIYVLEGRGFFHVSGEDHEKFDSRKVRHVPVRSRDVLLFKRGTVHTFSTGPEPLVLLSYHSPFVPLNDPRQYTLPCRTVLPGEVVDAAQSQITCDPAWSRLI